MALPLLITAIWAITAFTLYIGIFWFMLYFENRSKMRIVPVSRIRPSLSIIIPAFNEAGMIERCMVSLSGLDYPKKPEIIVVNDGSTDGTEKIAARTARKISGRAHVKIISQKNRGKGAALNAGIRIASGELVAVMDADSVVEKDALLRSVGYFEEKMTGAVVSSIIPLERKRFIEKIQSPEYIISCLYRRLGSLAKMVYVIPGAFSLYRKSALKKVGGFDEKNLTEDMEIALRLAEHGYIVRNSMTSIAYTKLPDTFGKFYRQRMRWYRGLLRNIWNYRHMLFNRKYGYLGTFQLPMNIIFPVVSLIVAAMALYVGFSYFINSIMELQIIGLNLDFSLEKTLIGIDWRVMIPWFTVFGFGAVVMAAGYRTLETSMKNTVSKPVALIFLLIYYTIINLLWFVALIKEVRRNEAKW